MKKLMTLMTALTLAVGSATLVAQTHKEEPKADKGHEKKDEHKADHKDAPKDEHKVEHKEDHKGKSK
jgi:hypothetical protein